MKESAMPQNDNEMQNQNYVRMPGTWQWPKSSQPVDKSHWRECTVCGCHTPAIEGWERQDDGSIVRNGTCTYVCAFCDHSHVGVPDWSEYAKRQNRCYRCDSEIGVAFQCPECQYPRGWMRVQCPSCSNTQPTFVPHWEVHCDMCRFECVQCKNAFDSLCIC